MARTISPSTITAIVSGVLVVLILGYLGYLFQFATQATTVASSSQQYNTNVLSTELDPQNAHSVFALTTTLTTPTTSTSGGVTYDPSELGKTDITQADK